ncbi:MAG: AMP-binding protein [Halioglobus sp.]
MNGLISSAEPAVNAAYYKNGQRISASQLNAQRERLVGQLDDSCTHILNLCACRLHFTLGFGAALLANKVSLLPANHQPQTILNVLEKYPHTQVLFDSERAQAVNALLAETDFSSLDIQALVPEASNASISLPDDPVGSQSTHWDSLLQRIAGEQQAAIVFTSGSTGEPTEIVKHWGTLVGTTQLLQKRFTHMAQDASLLATVPPQHMYGLETTVMMNLWGGTPVCASQPFFPADIVSELSQLPEPRLLITTPFHLETLLDSDLPLPPVTTVVSATAPLKKATAERAEQLLGCTVEEIYGCSEAGSLATRRSATEEHWELLDGITIAHSGSEPEVSGPHLDAPVPLQDELDILSPERFRFLGRSADMVNVAGKRGSLAQLSAQLRAIEGVSDAVFFMRNNDAKGVQRPAALVVTDQSERDIKKALATVIDPVFMPRPLKRVTEIPRNSVGKIPREHLLSALEGNTASHE